MGVWASAGGHQHSVQPLYGFLTATLLLDVQGEAAIALLLNASGRALRVDVEASNLILLAYELAAFLVKASQRQRLYTDNGDVDKDNDGALFGES